MIPFFIFLNKNKQQERKEVSTKSSDGKSKDSGVSQAAVQAFLAKKEMEKKQKAGRRNWSLLGFILLIPAAKMFISISHLRMKSMSHASMEL